MYHLYCSLLCGDFVADPKILKSGGAGGGRQFISSVLIYRKCTQRSIGLLHGKGGLLEKKLSQWGAAPIAPHH